MTLLTGTNIRNLDDMLRSIAPDTPQADPKDEYSMQPAGQRIRRSNQIVSYEHLQPGKLEV
jgi:hypothetical protein